MLDGGVSLVVEFDDRGRATVSITRPGDLRDSRVSWTRLVTLPGWLLRMGIGGRPGRRQRCRMSSMTALLPK